MSKEVNEVMTIFQITAKFVHLGVIQMRNVHHFEFPGYTPSTTELQEAVDAVDASYKTNLKPAMPNDTQSYGYDVRRVDIGDQPSIEYNATAGDWVGDSAVDCLPPQCAGLVTWKALTAFPRTCRSYLPPFTENANNASGKPESATITRMEDFGLDLVTLAITGQTDANKVSVKYGGSPRAVIDSNPTDTVTVSDFFQTQRRRTFGVGI